MTEPLLITLFTLSIFLSCRNNWVARVRKKWIWEDVFYYQAVAPSYDYMLFCRPWCWSDDIEQWRRATNGNGDSK